MWRRGKQSIFAGDESTNVIVGRDVYFFPKDNVPIELVDQKIEEEVEKIRKSRFFSEFDRTGLSLRLGRRLEEGDLSGGSDEMRGRGLAWCTRILCPSGDLERAKFLLELSKTLGDSPESKIAEAFVVSQKGDKAAALQILASINSPASRSAGLMIVAHHDGAESALRWMTDAGHTAEHLDSDGKSFLLTHQLQLCDWEQAAKTAGILSETDFAKTPILHHLAALSILAPTVPDEFRAAVLTHVPFEVRGFPLASDSDAMEARRTAQKHFLDAVNVAKLLACPRAVKMDDEYALWLELCDPTQSAHGMNRLENKLRDTDTALGFVHYGLQFGMKLDLGAVERDIERSIAINGGITIDAALARFALAFAQPTPEVAANYIAQHHNQLATHIDTKLMRYRQIELFSRAGLIDRANEMLDQLLEEEIPAEQESNLRRIISEAQGSDPVESRKAQYEATGTLSDLINLVTELEDHKRWDDLCEFGRLLFEETRALKDAERLVNAFSNTQMSEELVDFLRENNCLLSQSKYLRMSYAWGLYYSGALIESRAMLAELGDEVCSPNYRALQVNVAIATGDWGSLSAYIANEYQNRDDRSAHDLISAAQIALHLGSPHAKDIVFEAAAKANDDSAVLAAAYFIATSAGWENDPKVFKWLEKAAEISGDNGPLQKMNLKDILERKPEWDRRESETWRLLEQGRIPIFLAAQSLNRTLIGLMTFPALANLVENDPRRRNAIPAYSGRRISMKFDVRGKTVAIDATAMLTLSFLNLLDVTLDTFETVYIPHSTLGWLFEERQKASFHQPSRIANARKLRDFIATSVLEKFTPSIVGNSDLSAQVGDELAALIAEAEKVRDGDETRHIVVRSAPVHRLSSLMEEEADLSIHAAVLSSCLAVVEKLKQKGAITAAEEKRARAYLQLHEIPWPNQPDIADGATIYLDGLAISYLLHLGLLGKLKSAGLTAVASPREVSEADALLSYERISDEVKEVIERIRAALNPRIESCQIRVSKRHKLDQLCNRSVPEDPSFDIISVAPHCDAVIVDDRFFNQHANVDNGGTLTPVLSTHELLDTLVDAGVISDDDRLEYRTQLRRAGYFFVSVTTDEVEKCLRESTVDSRGLVETAELKAIRESILRIRMCDWLRLPEEALWLDGVLKTFVRVIKKQWVDEADIEEITARSDWLFEQIDIRGWGHSFVPEDADNVVQIGRAAFILLLLMPPSGVRRRVVDAYWKWVEASILSQLEEQFPEVYERIVDLHRLQIAEVAETQVSEGDNL